MRGATAQFRVKLACGKRGSPYCRSEIITAVELLGAFGQCVRPPLIPIWVLRTQAGQIDARLLGIPHHFLDS
jgi:hypothetical protein